MVESGNAVFRDRATRERLRKDLGVLCVEMEAAGLTRAGEMTGVVVCDQSIHANNLQAAADAKPRELIQPDTIFQVLVKQITCHWQYLVTTPRRLEFEIDSGGQQESYRSTS
jgi:hypothetical protein